jgi:hypothetical protein
MTASVISLRGEALPTELSRDLSYSLKVSVLNRLPNKVKNKIYHTVGTVPKSNRKITERDTINNPMLFIQ